MSQPFTIKRSFHFYAAHRNDDLPGQRCHSIHGHTYMVDVYVECYQLEDRSYSVLFSDIEKRVNAVLEPFEHSLMINKDDPFLPTLETLPTKLYLVDGTPSAENVSRTLFYKIKEDADLNIVRLDLRETTTSVVTCVG